MPERKSLMPGDDIEIGRIDATTPLSTELGNTLARGYPRLTPEVENAYANRQVDALSFKMNEKVDTIKAVLRVALERGSDPNDSTAYSEHGAEHATFQESTAALIDSIDRNEATWKLKKHDFNVQLDTGEVTRVSGERLVVESSEYERVTFVPDVQLVAGDIRKSGLTERQIIAKVKQETLEKGAAYGILLSTYLGIRARDIFDIMGEQNFVRSMKSKYGDKVKVPTPNRPADRGLLMDLAESLVVMTSEGKVEPVRKSEAFNTALERLVNARWLDETDLSREEYRRTSITQVAVARAVFRGLAEVAHRAAPSNFYEPERTEHIDRNYRGASTTELLTSFLVIDPS